MGCEHRLHPDAGQRLGDLHGLQTAVDQVFQDLLPGAAFIVQSPLHLPRSTELGDGVLFRLGEELKRDRVGLRQALGVGVGPGLRRVVGRITGRVAEPAPGQGVGDVVIAQLDEKVSKARDQEAKVAFDLGEVFGLRHRCVRSGLRRSGRGPPTSDAAPDRRLQGELGRIRPARQRPRQPRADGGQGASRRSGSG